MIIKLPISYVHPENTTTPEAAELIGVPSFATMSIPP